MTALGENIEITRMSGQSPATLRSGQGLMPAGVPTCLK
jgi:hypothetical protein